MTARFVVAAALLFVATAGRAGDDEQAPGETRRPFLGFESRADVDWEPYAARIKPIVRSNWRIAGCPRGSGFTQVRFFIERDGVVTGLAIDESSGRAVFDRESLEVIRRSSPFPPPPLPTDHDEDRVGVRWVFFYDYTERDIARWERGLPPLGHQLRWVSPAEERRVFRRATGYSSGGSSTGASTVHSASRSVRSSG
ncbi:MAG: TonB family protein [Acidobacteriota bacterium]